MPRAGGGRLRPRGQAGSLPRGGCASASASSRGHLASRSRCVGDFPQVLQNKEARGRRLLWCVRVQAGCGSSPAGEADLPPGPRRLPPEARELVSRTRNAQRRAGLRPPPPRRFRSAAGEGDQGPGSERERPRTPSRLGWGGWSAPRGAPGPRAAASSVLSAPRGERGRGDPSAVSALGPHPPPGFSCPTWAFLFPGWDWVGVSGSSLFLASFSWQKGGLEGQVTSPQAGAPSQVRLLLASFPGCPAADLSSGLAGEQRRVGWGPHRQDKGLGSEEAAV